MNLVSKSYSVRFVIVFDKRTVSLPQIFANIIQQNVFEELRDLKAIIRSGPIYLALKTVDHTGREFYLAVARYTLFQIIDVSGLQRKTLQIVDRWRAVEPTDFQNCRIALSNHALPERLKKYIGRNL